MPEAFGADHGLPRGRIGIFGHDPTGQGPRTVVLYAVDGVETKNSTCCCGRVLRPPQIKIKGEMTNLPGINRVKTLLAMFGALGLMAMATSQGVAQVLDGPHGPVEFIGLQDWTAQELFDSIRELEPDRPFHACAAVMKQQLGFPDAAAFLYFTGSLEDLDQSSNRYTVVVGVEDSTGVQYRVAGSETITLPEAWVDLQDAVGEDMNTLGLAAQTFHQREIAEVLVEAMGVGLEAVKQAWDLIGRAGTNEDLALAHEILAKEESWSVRVIATLVLGNFTGDDTSWHGLVGSLTDSDGRVRTVAQRMLQGMTALDRDPVGWSGAREPLLALFGGTNPFAFEETLEALAATGVEPDFGRQLARERPELLLAYVGAEHEGTREPAIAFLKSISGEDFGADVESWAAWISR